MMPSRAAAVPAEAPHNRADQRDGRHPAISRFEPVERIRPAAGHARRILAPRRRARSQRPRAGGENALWGKEHTFIFLTFMLFCVIVISKNVV